MKFDELDKKMRIYESSNDTSVLPEMYIVARIDGRGFTKLTKEKHDFIAPFDERFRDHMIETTRHLMNCGFKIVYGYTQSDEISLLFGFNETSFARKRRKLISILAGEASARFSLSTGSMAAFDCRISELPNKQLVIDYFRWRNEDAHRNSLNAYCYWKLREHNFNKKDATKQIERKSIADKNELLFSYGINYNDLPNWQKRGVGLYWKTVIVEGYNPKEKKKVNVNRNQLYTDLELPMKDEYDSMILKIIDQSL